MRISTKHKIMLARLAYFGVSGFRRLARCDDRAEVRRGGVNWSLNLREGIDFAIYLTGYFEPRTVAAYRRLLAPGSVAVDIGANMGAHTLHLSGCVGRDGHVLAFEPTAEAYCRLTRNIAINPELSRRIKAMQTMLVAAPDMNLDPILYASWPLHSPSDTHDLHLGVALSTEGANISTLDDAVAATGLDRVDLIKLDVDGHELDVLRGARRILKQHHPAIVMEWSPYTIEERGQDPSDLIALLLDHGYRFCGLTGRSLATANGAVPEIPAGYSMNVLAIA